MRVLQTRSMTCWPPLVTSTSAGSMAMPSAAMTCSMQPATAAMPSVGPYWRARAAFFAARCESSAAIDSGGNVEVSGSPPASEMTSGRSVMAMRSRMADDVMTRVRAAKRPAYRSRSFDDERAPLRPCGGPSSIVMPPPRYPNVHLFLDICQGLGLALAAGIRPFFPALVAGLLAMADWGIDFEGTRYAFLEDPVWLGAVAVLMILTFVLRRTTQGPTDAAIGGMGIGLGALLFAGTPADPNTDSPRRGAPLPRG